jgi:DNA-binding beta-propeller fold protein YncE
VQFELVEDECEIRANTLGGYRGEPAIDILWEKISADAPHSVDWYRTIELPFIAHDIDVDASGNIYAIEQGAPMIHKLDRDGNPVISWGGEGEEAGEFSFAPPADGPPLDGGFVVVGEAGRVYVSDSYNNRVQIFDEQGEFVDIWEGYGPEGARFDNPGPISVDESGNIYVADFSGVHQFEAQGDYIQTIPAAGEVALNSQGDIFTVIAFEHMALKMPAGGGDPLTWGGEGTGEGQFITPMWVVVRPDDSVYISDHSGRVQRFDSGGNFMALWAGPEDGDGPFTAPSSLSSDANGNIYVAPEDRPMIYLLSQ